MVSRSWQTVKELLLTVKLIVMHFYLCEIVRWLLSKFTRFIYFIRVVPCTLNEEGDDFQK